MLHKWKHLHRDESGMEALEYILILAFVVFPLTAIPFLACEMMTDYYYQVITDVISLPFP